MKFNNVYYAYYVTSDERNATSVDRVCVTYAKLYPIWWMQHLIRLSLKLGDFMLSTIELLSSKYYNQKQQ